jgi:hypothetical protein
MRFFFRKSVAPRWVDSADLAWVPDAPLRFEPAFAPGSDFTAAQPEPTPEVAPTPDVAPEPVKTETPPAPANSNIAPSLLGWRLAIGLAQGLGLCLLYQSRAIGVWPGSDPYLFAALSLAGLFAPLVLLEGLGDVPVRRLSIWTIAIAAVLGGLGWYHHWRIQAPDQAHAGFALAVLTALILLPAQALLHATLDGWHAPYRNYFDAAWTLAARMSVWAVLTALAWALIGSGDSLLNWLRAHHTALHVTVDPTLVILPLVGVAGAAALHLTASRSWVLRQTKNALLACCTIALPLLVAVALVTLAVNFVAAPVSLAWALILALLLVIALNASYRGDTKRGQWRKASEFTAAFLIVALVALAALALNTRTIAYGWTGDRVFACAALVMLGCYGAAYSAAALISIGGGRWMQRIEAANISLALLLIVACAALATPLADPVKLAVTAQSQRLQSGRADPATFDYDYLRRSGLRFGHGALLALTAAPFPDIARDAAISLRTAPNSEAPTPTEIGANITVRTPGARLPNSLLEHDWSKTAGVPPCLTKPALACDAWFLDLDGDGVREILLVYGNDARWWASVMKADARGNWSPAATLASPACRGTLAALRAGVFTTADPLPGWRDLWIAGQRLTPAPAAKPAPPCF